MLEDGRGRSPRCWRACAGRRSRGAQAPVACDFQKVTLDDNTQNPMELDVAPDGRVFYIERDGRLMIWKPEHAADGDGGHGAGHAQPGERPARPPARAGLRHSASWVYLFYSQLPDNTNTQVISRFKVNGDTLDLSSEQKILTFQHQRGQCCHSSRLAVLRPRRQPLHLDRRQHEPVRLRRLQPDRRARRPRRLGRAAHVGQHERPQRQDPAHQADGDPDRHARRRHDVHDPGRQPLRRAGTRARPGRRSSAWASATRSASRSTRRPAGC